MNSLLEKTHREIDAQNAIKKLIKPQDRVYCTVLRVAPSGRSRRMKFFIVKDGEILNITHIICNALSYKYSTDGSMIISGCGMDMGFHVVYSLGSVLWPHGDGKTVTGRNGDTKPETDGGYLLKYSYL